MCRNVASEFIRSSVGKPEELQEKRTFFLEWSMNVDITSLDFGPGGSKTVAYLDAVFHQNIAPTEPPVQKILGV
jgi:hypothetical protein